MWRTLYESGLVLFGGIPRQSFASVTHTVSMLRRLNRGHKSRPFILKSMLCRRQIFMLPISCILLVIYFAGLSSALIMSSTRLSLTISANRFCSSSSRIARMRKNTADLLSFPTRAMSHPSKVVMMTSSIPSSSKLDLSGTTPMAGCVVNLIKNIVSSHKMETCISSFDFQFVMSILLLRNIYIV